MHLWNIDALADELRTGKLTEVQSFRYFLFVLLAETTPFFLPVRSEGPLTFYSMGFGAVVPFIWLATGIAGVIVCFRVNQQSDGVDFIRRFICLAVPSSVRTFAVGLPILLLTTLIVRPFVPGGDSHTVVYVVMGFVTEAMIVIQCLMIYRRLRGSSNSEPGTQRAAA
jgi:hypothetical protein